MKTEEVRNDDTFRKYFRNKEYIYVFTNKNREIEGTKQWFIDKGLISILDLIEKHESEERVKKLRESLKRGNKIQQLRQVQKDRRRLYGK